MPEELLPSDAEQYTKGRLSQTDPDVARGLASALSRARNYCGWHVSPVRTETIALDGPGRTLLLLPTLKVVAITDISIGGESIDLATVRELADTPGALYRERGWPCGFSNIAVTFSHGFTQAECEDFREAVLSLLDQASMSAGTGRAGPMIGKRVDDIDINWSGLPREVDNAPLDKRALAPYRLLGL